MGETMNYWSPLSTFQREATGLRSGFEFKYFWFSISVDLKLDIFMVYEVYVIHIIVCSYWFDRFIFCDTVTSNISIIFPLGVTRRHIRKVFFSLSISLSSGCPLYTHLKMSTLDRSRALRVSKFLLVLHKYGRMLDK